MVVSSVSNSSFSRAVTPSKNSSDRETNEENQAAIIEKKTQERAVEQRAAQKILQQQREDTQRRLDGRLISFGFDEKESVTSQQKQASLNRIRVNEAYSPPESNEVSHKQRNQRSHDIETNAINIVV